MIKINLLPTKRKKKPKPVPPFIIVGVFLLFFSIISAVYAIYFINDELDDLGRKRAENSAKLKILNEKIKEVRNFEDLNRTFTERKQIIEKLSIYQSLPAKIMDEMSMRLTEGVWLNSMNIQGDRISIRGIGFSTTDIVTYVQTLKDSEMFTDVVLNETSASTVGENDVFNFSITMALRTEDGEV